MTNAPLNTIRLNDAGLLIICPRNETASVASSEFDQLWPLAEAAGAGIHVFTDESIAPWNQPVIVEIVKSRAWMQFIVLCDRPSVFADTLAIMALEQGYDVYVVCRCIDEISALSVSRLEKSGATLMMFNRFLAECRYGARSADESETE